MISKAFFVLNTFPFFSFSLATLDYYFDISSHCCVHYFNTLLSVVVAV